MPTGPEVLRDVADRGPRDVGAHVVPAERGAGAMGARVEAVPRLRGQVDAADEGDAVIDDDRLLVVAVQRALARIQRAADPRTADQVVAHRPDGPARGREDRQRRPRPGEHADVDPIGGLRQQVAQDHRLGAPRERELRREEPAGDVDVGPGALDLGRDPRKGLRAVDENLDLVPRPRWGTAGGPAAGVGVEGSQPADPRESAPVMGDPGPGHRRAEEAVRAERDTGG